MRQASILFVLFLFISSFSFAQEPLEHEKKWYVNEDGRFFINKDLGVYLRIATSPDEDAKSHLLKSETAKEYSNPMYFDTEGYNSIRSPWAWDPKSKEYARPQRDIIFEVYADGKAPNTRSKFKNAPSYRAEGNIYYGKNLSVELTSNDAVSKVKDIYYSINGSPYEKYSGELKFTSEDANEYTLKYYAVDHVGNAEEPITKEFIVDETPPVTKPEILGKKVDGNKISGDAKLAINASDDHAGVKQVKYILDDNEPKVYSNPLPAAYIKTGAHQLTVYSIDNVENSNSRNVVAGGDRQKEFIVDKVAPEVSMSIQGDKHEGKYTYISERTKLKLDATDTQTDVKAIYYGVNDDAEANTYSSPFNVNTDKGLQYVRFAAEDELDNKSDAEVERIFMDNVTPVTAIDYKRPQFFNRDTLFITKNTEIEVFSKDYESGVQQIEYALDEEDYKEFTGNFTVSEPGYHNIKFRGIDNVNNTEEARKSSFFVDNTAPTIYANFSIEAIGRETREGNTYKVYPTYAKLYLGATDKDSGAESIHYSINSGKMQEYASQGNIDVSEAKLLKEEGFYEVNIVSKDKLDNESTKIIKFFIRER